LTTAVIFRTITTANGKLLPNYERLFKALMSAYLPKWWAYTAARCGARDLTRASLGRIWLNTWGRNSATRKIVAAR